jgi:hypothetical protein
LSWVSGQEGRNDEKTYNEKMRFVPSDPRLRKLWNYINETNDANEKSEAIESNDAIDYEQCIGFFC